jgi:hypothetical protein
MYKIKLCDLKSQLSDGYKNIFFAAFFFLLILGIFGSESTFVKVICIGGVCGAIPSLWLGLSCEMRIRGQGDRLRIESYLSGHFHVKRESDWAPKLPQYARFKSQSVKFAGELVVGPRVTVERLKTLLSDS